MLGDTNFKKDENGRALFYPFGVLQRPYLVEDPKRANSMRAMWRGLGAVGLLVVVTTIFLARQDQNLALAIFLVFGIGAIALIKIMTRGLGRVGKRMKLSESVMRTNPTYRLLMLVLCGGLALRGVYRIVSRWLDESSLNTSLEESLAISILGIIALYAAYTLLLRWRLRSSEYFKQQD